MLSKIERERIRTTKTTEKSNCIGTVLYICGVIERDEYVGVGEKRWEENLVNNYLKTLTKTDRPSIGTISVVRNNSYGDNFIRHMGLITGDDPYTVFHRIGKNYPTAIISLEGFMRTYNYDFNFVEFYSRNN